MTRKKISVPAAIVSVLLAIGSAGCAGQPATETAKTANANQSQTNLSNGSANVSVLPNAASPAAAGVNNNNSNINSSATPSNSSRDARPPVAAVPEATPVIGGGGNDFFLLSQARGALSADKDLINAVIVEIKDGNVTLTGSVATEAQKIKAGQLVQNVAGIKSVKNNLRVAS